MIYPLDGSILLLIGLPDWCVVRALTEGKATHLGVTVVPVTGETAPRAPWGKA
ncbi:hypothetical protein P6F28_02065 [Roseicyclus marinus]|uniref:hypothetical protein n=1 Tax=Roseicyclus marinus TaxID=2161673 RepID=UPI00240F4F6A|nr:hypothetical protein [Roseicyclus marinus]MDG3040051.1 hypothetical protein [Roseicyclus marinus]